MVLVEQTLRDWMKAVDVGTLNGAGAAKVTPEMMELSRLGAESARLKREVDILRSDGVLRAGCTVKYAWLDAHHDGLALDELCDVLDFIVGGYRA